MLTYALVRIVHILAGVFWAGSVLFITAFLAPTARRIPGGGPLLGQFFTHSRFVRTLPIAGSLNVLSGVFLYWGDSQGFQLSWVLSPTGLTFTLGALATIAAAIAGAAQGRAASRLPATPDDQRPALLARISRGEAFTSALLVLAVSAMACARYV